MEECIAYSTIVDGCDGRCIAGCDAMQSKASNNAKELYDALLKKFRMQMELANFNSLKIEPHETFTRENLT